MSKAENDFLNEKTKISMAVDFGDVKIMRGPQNETAEKYWKSNPLVNLLSVTFIFDLPQRLKTDEMDALAFEFNVDAIKDLMIVAEENRPLFELSLTVDLTRNALIFKDNYAVLSGYSDHPGELKYVVVLDYGDKGIAHYVGLRDKKQTQELVDPTGNTYNQPKFPFRIMESYSRDKIVMSDESKVKPPLRGYLTVQAILTGYAFGRRQADEREE